MTAIRPQISHYDARSVIWLTCYLFCIIFNHCFVYSSFYNTRHVRHIFYYALRCCQQILKNEEGSLVSFSFLYSLILISKFRNFILWSVLSSELMQMTCVFVLHVNSSNQLDWSFPSMPFPQYSTLLCIHFNQCWHGPDRLALIDKLHTETQLGEWPSSVILWGKEKKTLHITTYIPLWLYKWVMCQQVVCVYFQTIPILFYFLPYSV